MEAWVIKRDDGFYWNCNLGWCFIIAVASFYQYPEYALEVIKRRCLEGCKPVKVRIEEVENE